MHLAHFIHIILATAPGLQVLGQHVGSLKTEFHPTLTTQKCTKSGGCVSSTNKIVIDQNWRWIHGPAPNYSNCFPGPGWDSTLCPDPNTCTQNCYLEGATQSDYINTYGINAVGGNLTLLLYPSGSTGSRVYLLSDDTHYQEFQLKNQEFTFDVDVSGLPCGANGALYFTNMAADGGSSLYSNNQGGAKYGTGYCDAQCPRDIKFINGQANSQNFNTATGQGRYGTCCHELDIWEANAYATAYTAHPCSTLGQYRCDSSTSTDCSSTGVCDQAGCDFNPYRNGNKTFYGLPAGDTVSTNPGTMRVITQFITSDGTATGTLTEIRRYYIRGGKVISNAVSKVSGVSGNSLTDAFCAAEKSAFGEGNTFKAKGGMAGMSSALGLGMVLTMSVWVDYATDMLWLDSAFPAGAATSTPGVLRGPCATNTGDPAYVKANYPNAQVRFSNIKFGDIGTTYGPPYP